MRQAASPSRRRVLKLALLLGYLSLLVGAVAARRAPATAYEVSLYTGTPLAFWVGVAVAVLVGVTVALGNDGNRWGILALGLLTLAMVAVFALPSLRGYYFYGHGDSLMHLGWAKDLADGRMAPTDLLYPAAHLSSVLLAELAGVEVRTAMVLATLGFKLVFVAGVGLAAYALLGDRRAGFYGVGSGLLLLPINQVSVHEHFHAFSLAVMFSPFVFYLVIAHVTHHHVDRSLPGWLSPAGLVLPVASTALVVLHPQAAFDVLLFFGAFVLTQYGVRRHLPGHPVSRFGGLGIQFLVLLVVFSAWAAQFENTVRVLESTLTSVQDTVAGTAETGEIVRQRGQSSASLGVGLPELFGKLFGVSALYCALVVLFVHRRLRGRLEDAFSETDGVVLYFAVGGVVFAPYVAVHFLGDIDAFLFRHVGFAMSVVTLLGAVALYSFDVGGLGTWLPVDRRAALGAVTLLALVLSLSVVFASPYLLLPNAQVTETELEGYDTLFEAQDPDVPIVGVRVGADRFVTALQYEEGSVALGATPNGSVFERGLQRGTDGDRYLAYSTHDYRREVDVYRGLRYSERGFARLAVTPAVHRVQTNGDLAVYYVD